MKAGALYLLAHAAVAVLGLPVLWLADVRAWSLPARVAAAFAAGAMVLALESTLSTLSGVSWDPLIVLAPPLLLAVLLARRAKRGRAASPGPGFHPGRGPAAFGILAGGIAFAHLALSLAVARATSTDFLLFWGVKAVHLAASKGVDPAWLGWRFFQHGQPFYPPLVPTLDAWGVLAAGHMPWRAAPLATLLWFGAAAILVLEIQRRRLGDRDGTLVAAFWMAALSASLVASFSGANAEAPLLLYETTAGMLLLTEGTNPDSGRRLLAGIFLAGAVLTKIEGTIGSSLLILGAAGRDLLIRRRLLRRETAALVIPPLFAGLLWWSYLRRFGIAARYATKGRLAELHWDRIGDIVGSLVENLRAGTWWLAWIIPTVMVLAAARRRCGLQALPGLVFVAGLLLFFLFIYLHETTSQFLRISWEIPRTSQPALSLLIGVGALCFPPDGRPNMASDS